MYLRLSRCIVHSNTARKKACHEETVTMSIDCGGAAAAGGSQSTVEQPHPFHTQLPSHSSLSSHAMQMRFMSSQPAGASSSSAASSSVAGMSVRCVIPPFFHVTFDHFYSLMIPLIPNSSFLTALIPNSNFLTALM